MSSVYSTLIGKVPNVSIYLTAEMSFYINYLYVNQNLTGSQCLCPTILPRFHKINLNLYWWALLKSMCGDFNINLRKIDSRLLSLKRLLSYHGFFQCHSDITHRAGSCLDHVYVNKNIVDSAVTPTTPIHYSDHFVVTLCFPFQLLY